MNRLLGTDRAIVTPTPGTTRDVVEGAFELDANLYRLLDTAGIRRKPKVTAPVEYYSVTRAIDQIQHCDVALVMFDAFDGPTNQDKRIVNLVMERNKGMVIIANKMDTVPPNLKQKVRDWVRRELAFADFAPVIFTSVLKDKGVLATVRAARKVWESGGTQIPNARLRAKLLPRLEQLSPGRDVRVLGLSQVGTRPPTFRLRVTRPDEVTADYERFVVSQIRRRFEFIGYPVRLKVTR
jgi:GTP-binding protein